MYLVVSYPLVVCWRTKVPNFWTRYKCLLFGLKPRKNRSLKLSESDVGIPIPEMLLMSWCWSCSFWTVNLFELERLMSDITEEHIWNQRPERWQREHISHVTAKIEIVISPSEKIENNLDFHTGIPALTRVFWVILCKSQHNKSVR